MPISPNWLQGSSSVSRRQFAVVFIAGFDHKFNLLKYMSIFIIPLIISAPVHNGLIIYQCKIVLSR